MLGIIVNLYPAPDSSASNLNDSDYLMRLSSVWGDDLLDSLQEAFLDFNPQDALTEVLEPLSSLNELLCCDTIKI